MIKIAYFVLSLNLILIKVKNIWVDILFLRMIIRFYLTFARKNLIIKCYYLRVEKNNNRKKMGFKAINFNRHELTSA